VFSTTVGYGACRPHPDVRSDERHQTDDRTGTITIHPSTPDPALPQARDNIRGPRPTAPLPDSNKPVPGTGPYMVSKLSQQGHGGFLLTQTRASGSGRLTPAGRLSGHDPLHAAKGYGAAPTAVEQGKADDGR
jgi:hypothetical protein